MNNDDIKILVVDDDPDILFATLRILKQEGYEMLGAETGNDCLEKVSNAPPDLILLDIQLPDISGIEVCLKLKNNPDHLNIYVMMMSGIKISSDDQADGLDAGADGYIARPVSNRELISRVTSMVRLIRVERKNDCYLNELKQAMDKIKVLSGVIPICMYCKQIRDDKGYWNQLEEFISSHSDALFSYCVCDDCLKKHYPDKDA